MPLKDGRPSSRVEFQQFGDPTAWPAPSPTLSAAFPTLSAAPAIALDSTASLLLIFSRT